MSYAIHKGTRFIAHDSLSGSASEFEVIDLNGEVLIFQGLIDNKPEGRIFTAYVVDVMPWFVLKGQQFYNTDEERVI